ncbi:MAG: hypothetical protein K5912_01775 [Alphaproteobacteria bacterium]|nr:hypothetical protein [Alphaproteobacteria bacterium]
MNNPKKVLCPYSAFEHYCAAYENMLKQCVSWQQLVGGDSTDGAFPKRCPQCDECKIYAHALQKLSHECH